MVSNIKEEFSTGLRDGIPICMGYVSVAFTFGLMCTENGLPFWIAVLISLSNLTSAGQFAGTASVSEVSEISSWLMSQANRLRHIANINARLIHVFFMIAILSVKRDLQYSYIYIIIKHAKHQVFLRFFFSFPILYKSLFH